ncbi:MAG: EAL domain-containing protein [Hespellia sp.]|nr:EAL domain-containing protein [Hespellia sp.]
MKEKPTVLIVDDEHINRKILGKMLSVDFDVLEAENGQMAWEILQEKQDDIAAVLLDIIMPVMGGYEFLGKVRTAGMTDLPIIVMTGESDTKSEQKALDDGAWDFVAKPYKPRILLSRLRNAIARSQVSMYERIQHMSEHDSLTGLHNRGKMYADTKKMLAEHPDHAFAFLRIDIDHFALFNSSFGETEGDRLLCYIANLIRVEARQVSFYTYGRMNADIFVMCMEYHDNKDAICAEVNKAETMLRNYKEDYLLNLSVGVCIIDDPKLSVEEYYIRASMAAAICKNQYEKNIGFYDNSLGRQAAEELEISNEMQTALEEKQFLVYLQPKFAVSTDTICGAEALVRWNHPKKGLISPGLFVPVFERNGFIAKVDYYVWERTCQMLRKWMDSGETPFPVSVNISRISMYNPNLVKVLTNLVEQYKISPSFLQLEVTESAYMTNMELMAKTIHELRDSGFTILMDDFGSGYSSLNTLKSIEVDILKIDMKFLPEGREMEKGEIILASIIRMANWIGMSVIVEGVETRRQRDFLEGVGCDCIQGYYYSRPIPEEEYEANYIYKNKLDSVQQDLEEIVPKHNVTILVIDDDDVDRAILEEYFKEEYHVHQSCDAEDALAYLKHNSSKVRLILVDNVMEGMSGIDFMKFCHTEKGLNSIPMIMITANERVEDQVTAFQAGAYDYITKPLVKEIVLARVKHVMDISNQLSSLKRDERAFRHQMEVDPDTGLLNKKAFRTLCTESLNEASYENKILVIVDIDDFEQLSKEYGYAVGDEMIEAMANNLQKTFRKTDLIGRFGGDEFIILVHNLSNVDAARRKADEIIKGIMLTGARRQIQISASIGLARCEQADTFDTVFARADQALYDAKNTGKGKVVIYGEQVLNDDK